VTNSCTRLQKEIHSYEKEAKQEKERVQSLRLEGAEPAVVRKQEEIVKETLGMIPQVFSKLKDTADELSSLLAIAVSGDKTLTESEEYLVAKQKVEELTKFLNEFSPTA